MTLLRLFRAALLLAPFLYQLAAAQVLDPTFTPPTGLYAPGNVGMLGPVQPDGKRLVAGSFSRVNGVAVSNLVRLDAAGALDIPFSQNVGITASAVYRIRRQANGQYLLGGNPSSGVPLVTAGGLTRAGLLRLNADGTADATFNAGAGPHRLPDYGYGQEIEVQADGKILVSGSFDLFDGHAANGLVRLNADGSVDDSFNVGTGPGRTDPEARPVVSKLALLPNGQVLVLGEFETFNGQPANSLVRLNANGTRDASFVAALRPNSSPAGLQVQSDGKVIVTGSLSLGPGRGEGMVRLTSTGALDPSFTASALANSGSITDLVLQPDGKLLVSGTFYHDGNQFALVRLNPNGSDDTSFQTVSGPTSWVTSIGLQADGKLLVAGGSGLAATDAQLRLRRVTATGAADPTFVPTKVQQPGSVTAVARQADGKLLLGGVFSEYNGQPVSWLLRLTAAGALDVAYSQTVSAMASGVNSLTVQADGKLLVCHSRGLRRLLPTGAPDPDFTSPFTDNTTLFTAVQQPDGKLLVGGVFWNLANNDNTHKHLVRLNANGSVDPSFVWGTPGADAPYIFDPLVLVQPDGRILVVSSVIGGYSSVKLSRYEATGQLDASFVAPTFTGAFYRTMALQPDGKLLLGGRFSELNGVPRANLVRLTATGAIDEGFVPPASLAGTVNTLAVQPNGRVLVGGSFTAGAYSNLLRVLPTGALDASFAPSANTTIDASFGSAFNTYTATFPYVQALLVQPDGAVVVAGFFNSVGGQQAHSLARLTVANVLAVAGPQAGADSRAAVWPVPAHTQLHIRPDASAQPRALALLDGLGRIVRTRAVAPGPEQVLDVAGLPAGIYLLRVQYATGTVSQRVAVE